MLNRLYARIVLFLIRPALELHKPKFDGQKVIDVVLKDFDRNGPIRRQMKGL